MNLRIRKGFILALTLALTLIGSSVAKANTNVDFAFSFHDALAPYGTWVQVSSYGQVWRPRASAGFVPYTEGHWAYTNYGPTWVGSEPCGLVCLSLRAMDFYTRIWLGLGAWL